MGSDPRAAGNWGTTGQCFTSSTGKASAPKSRLNADNVTEAKASTCDLHKPFSGSYLRARARKPRAETKKKR